MSAREPGPASAALREQLVAAARRELGQSSAVDPIGLPPGGARDALREQLVAAARHDHAERRAPRRRRRRRITGLVVVGLLGATAAAGAGGLISTGDPLPKPLPDTRTYDPRYGTSLPGGAKLVATARDPERRTSWGVGIYRADNGDSCVIAGQVQGVSLGLISGGRFRPYENLRTGACIDLRRRAVVWDRIVVGGEHPRTVLFGRTRAGERTVIATAAGKRYTTRPGPGGAFLFVFSGRLGYDRLHGQLGSQRP